MKRERNNCNMAYSLCNKESGSYQSPLRIEKQIQRELITSDSSHYEEVFCRESPRIIIYDNHRLHFDRYSTVVSFHGPNYSTKTRKVQLGNSEERVIDGLIKSVPYPSCRCNAEPCLCFKTYYILLTRDQWLLMCDYETGNIMNEVDLKMGYYDYQFSEIFWRDKGGQIFLHSYKSPNLTFRVVKSIAVFHASLKFQYMFEVERKVFGELCRDAFVKDHFLITMAEPCIVTIYSLDDVLKESVFRNDPAGINLKIQRAPPALFEAYCHGYKFVFGGFPYCCLHPNQHYFSGIEAKDTKLTFTLQSLDKDEGVEKTFGYDDIPVFHPTSNMVIVQRMDKVQFFDIVNHPKLDMVEKFEIILQNLPDSGQASKFCVKSVLAFSIQEDFNMIAVLGFHPNDRSSRGFIKIYDCASGQEKRSITLKRKLDESFKYNLYFEVDKIVMIKSKKQTRSYVATVFGLKRSHGA